MTIKQPEFYDIVGTTCTCCGKAIPPRGGFIGYRFYHHNDPKELVLGECCATTVLGALIQDYGTAMGSEAKTLWIGHQHKDRLERIIKACNTTTIALEEFIEYGY